MRLGQLARKLSLRPSQLVDYLAAHDIKTEEGSNTRLTDDHTRMIVLHFAPDSLEEIVKPLVDEDPIAEAEQPLEVEQSEAESTMSEQPVTETSVESVQQPEGVTEDNDSSTAQTEPEVIRVQRIELSGLKVLGKIDLPEPKKKEPKPEGEAEDQEQRNNKKGRLNKNPKRDRDQRWKNPLELQREREARLREEKRKAELEQEKEKRKLHYQSKVKPVKQAKRTKPAKETATTNKPVDTRPQPKTWLGKFLRWWTT